MESQAQGRCLSARNEAWLYDVLVLMKICHRKLLDEQKLHGSLGALHVQIWQHSAA